MGDNIVYKIIKKHIVDGEAVAGSSIGIKIDQTLTQDSTGTMTYLQLEAMGIDKVKTKRSVAFVDHNMLQQGLKMQTTISIYKQWQINMEFISLSQEMVFVIKYF